MSDRRKPWDSRARKHFRKVEKRQKRGKVVRAPLPPDVKNALEERFPIDSAEAPAD